MIIFAATFVLLFLPLAGSVLFVSHYSSDELNEMGVQDQ